MPNWTLKRGVFVGRHAETRIQTALRDTRIVAIIGPRQSGKTTLARRIAKAQGHPFVTLDDEQSRRFAQDDPAGFLRGLQTAAIDEIQRAPGLVLALKKTVDEDPRPGRFLITGSVDLLKGSISPDSLAGRVEMIELLPFSQAELAAFGPPRFLDRAFAADFPGLAETGVTDNLAARAVAGGFPEVLARAMPGRRRSWLHAYARSLAERDVPELAGVGKRAELGRLIEPAALATGQLLNMSRLGALLGIDSKTVDRWLTLLEHLFLIRRIPAWHRNELKRLVKAPKMQFLDSGLLAALRLTSLKDIAKDRDKLGPLLECFVHTEIAKAAAVSDESMTLRHYRDKDQVEVDLVLERSPGKFVGIEVKATATVRPKDLRGLMRLRDAVGDGFACGVILHDGERIQQMAPKLFAMPVKMLWEA